MSRAFDGKRRPRVRPHMGRSAICILGAVLAVAGCRRPAPPAPAIVRAGQDAAAIAAGQVAVYRRIGFLAPEGTMPFVGAARVAAGPTPDTTLVLVSFSLANRALTFNREGDLFAAAYVATLELLGEGRVLQRRSSREDVRVATFRETTRPEESVLFQATLAVPPGPYELRVRVEDAMGDNVGVAQTRLAVPWLGSGTFSSPMPVLGAEPRPARSDPLTLITNPRGTAVLGRDSVLQIYIEGYGSRLPAPLIAEVATSQGAVLYRDSVRFAEGDDVHTALLQLPVGRIGLGTLTLRVLRRGSGDVEPVAQIPIVVSLGEELAISTFEDMLEYLRYFTSDERLRDLREPDPSAQAAAWAALLDETDPDPRTRGNEALQDYLRRLQWANTQYRENGIAGWRTDRGMVYTALGEPDAVSEPTGGDANLRGRRVVWTYEDHRVEITFVDQTGFGRWRMTPVAEAEFQTVLRRLTGCVTCR